MFERFTGAHSKTSRASPEVVEQLDHAEALLRRMLKANLKPEWQLCEMLINSLGEFGLTQKAERVLSLLEDSGVENITATGLLAAQLHDGDHAAAEKTAGRIPVDTPHGQQAAYMAYMGMVMEACQLKHWDSAASYIAKCEPKLRPKMQNYMLNALVKSGDLKRAEKMLAELEKSPESLDALPYLSFVVHFIRQADLSAARKWVARMSERMGGMPPLASWPLITNLAALAAEESTPAAVRAEATEWLTELAAVPEVRSCSLSTRGPDTDLVDLQEQRALPTMPGAPTPPSIEEQNDLQERLSALKADMPEPLRKWMAKPTGELSEEHRSWLEEAMSELTSGRDQAAVSNGLLYSMLQGQFKQQPSA